MAETIEYMEQLGGTPTPFQMHSANRTWRIPKPLKIEISVGDLSYQMTDQHLHGLFSETVQDTTRPTDVEVEETRKRVRDG